MYAVIASGGKQHRVSEGDTIRVEKMPGDIGATVAFEPVLMVSADDRLLIGQPGLANTTVSGHIVEQDRGKKIIVFTYKRRKGYRKKRGHRQDYTAVKIDSIKVAE
ncbi:MAG: 50S ribosomal protein L21 [Pseudomonadota bacterium]